MADTTDINSIPMPQIDDVANIETAVRPAILALDSLVTARFSTLSARNTAITAPIEGQLCYVTETRELYIYDSVGSVWISAKPRVVRKLVSEDRTNDTYAVDNRFVFSAEAFSAYTFRMVAIMTVNSATPDMKIKWLGPLSGLQVYGGVGATPAVTNPADTNVNVAGGNGLATELQYGITNGFTNYVKQEGVFITGATAGDISMYWAHSTNSPGSTLSMGGGFLEVMKVA